MSLPDKLGDAFAKIRKHHDALQADTKAAGKTIHTLGQLVDAQEVIKDVLVFSSNQNISIDDRVSSMDKMLAMINALPKAKPDNWMWDELYTGHRGLMQFWTIFKSQRYFFSDYKVAEIEEYYETTVEERDASGNVRPVTRTGWNPRTVDPGTALEMYLSQPQGQETVKLLRTVQKGIPGPYSDTAFTKEFAEQCVNEFGEIVMVQSILLLLNYAFNEFNVPVNTLLMIQSMVQNQAGQTSVSITSPTQDEDAQHGAA